MATDLSLLLILVFTCCFSNSFTESRKELRTQEANQENVIQLGRSLPPNTIDPSRVTELSWQPRVFLYKGFLSDEECDHLISLDEITARIEERISAWTFLPKGNGMPFQVLHYGPEKIKENHNYLGNTFMRLNGESVIATIVMYLSNVTQGGQILFPGAESRSLGLKRKIWSDCRKSSETTKPIKGNAILFFNLHPNASLDPSSLHARCAIVEGDMWWATKIFVVKSVAGANSVSETSGDDGLCTDEDDNCPRWAAVGECDRNPIFMVGSADYYGTCRKSCNVC
ncbi:probable prolyl 4-hydroxylase 12 isoform X2 [Cynara cardunculus var. scolymus]|uniref:probable prolyl 4-hydroxylase 12 isoform X2 n=1 Tax=Cynara cardunculus var. scolymus TaxID=59895 RepID=UPI000D62B8B9|nr:probable prolyl 4-hydroxylase 12 isoform X2 [Cynara cardunculus var. scolymus]